MPTLDLDLSPRPTDSGVANPLGIISGVTSLQTQLLQQQMLRQQTQLFQQQMAARARFGQIVATAPDTETGLANAAKDPLVAPYAGEWIGQYRSSLLADQQYQNEQQKGAMEGVNAVRSALKPGIADPGMISGSIEANLAGLSHYAKSKAKDAVSSLETALTSNLPSDPDQARKLVQQRTIALSGALPDEVHSILGTPFSQDTGGAIASGVQAPSQGIIGGASPGAMTPSTIMTKGVAPSMGFTAGGMPALTPGITGGVSLPASAASNGMGGGAGSVPPMASNPLANAAAISTAGVPARSGVSPSGGSTSAAGSPPPPPTDIAGDGKPLIADPKALATTAISPINRGTNLNSLEQAQASKMITDFAADGPDQFRKAQIGLGQVHEINDDLDRLNAAGGWQTPGSLGAFRNGFAKLVQTVEQATGSKLDIDPQATASYEQLNKDTRRLGLSLLTSNLGNGHAAAETINGITQAVPSVDNTYLGAKLVNASIQAQFKYAADEYNFVNQAAKLNGGDIRDAYAEFAKQHPAEDYAKQVMQSFGLEHGVNLVPTKAGVGFKSLDDVKTAVSNGLLSRDEARAIAKQQGF